MLVNTSVCSVMMTTLHVTLQAPAMFGACAHTPSALLGRTKSCCQGAPGCLQVYVAYTEGRNFQRSLGDLLGLPSGASIGACLQRIRQLLDR